jgi:hypothetical protein
MGAGTFFARALRFTMLAAKKVPFPIFAFSLLQSGLAIV